MEYPVDDVVALPYWHVSPILACTLYAHAKHTLPTQKFSEVLWRPAMGLCASFIVDRNSNCESNPQHEHLETQMLSEKRQHTPPYACRQV